MNPYIYLLNGLPVNQPSGGSWVVASLTVTGNESVGGNLSVTGTGTFGGNLTVSGTGTSSIAGALGIGNASPSYKLDVTGETRVSGNFYVTNQINGSGRSLFFPTPTAALAYISSAYSDGHGSYRAQITLGAENYGSNDAGYIGFRTSSTYNTGTLSEVGRFTGSGNLLLKSDGVDSSNGKLQLATHTTSAGGIGFGTDISLYRAFGGYLTFARQDAGIAIFQIAANSANNSAYLDIRPVGTGSAIIQVSGNDAISIDSSKNATFAGTVTASTAGNYVLQLKDTRSQAADVGASIGLQGTYTGSSQTTFGSILGLKVNSTDGNFAGKLVFQTRPNGGSLTTALTLDDSQVATFAGAIAINNTVTAAASVVSTHKVTIKIGGTTYYLLASNV